MRTSRLFTQKVLRRCIALALSIPILATAQTYPDRAIQIINPYPPGTASDVTSREFANQLSKVLKQSVVVVNRPGAGGLIATQFAAQQTPDGYTLFAAANGTHVINPIINSNAKYDPVRDFVPISRMVSFPNILVVNSSQPVKNVAELAALARSRSKEPMTYGTGGNGTTSHIAAAQFEQLIGAKLLNIPYQGTITAVTETVAGRIDMVFGNLNISVPFIKTGQLRPLAISSATRHPLVPDTPTFKEVGYPQAEMNIWSGLVAPAGTPPAIIATLHRAMSIAVKAPGLIENYKSSGAEPEHDASPEAFAAFIKADNDKWGPVIRSLGVKVN